MREKPAKKNISIHEAFRNLEYVIIYTDETHLVADYQDVLRYSPLSFKPTHAWYNTWNAENGHHF